MSLAAFLGAVAVQCQRLTPAYGSERKKELPKRIVILIDRDGDTTLTPVIDAQGGMMARRHENIDSTIVRLLPDGNVSGVGYVKKWYPFSGFTSEEVEAFKQKAGL